VVVFEADHTLVRVLQVGPGLDRERQYGVGELAVLGGCPEAA
jgi:hypothetical protein